MKRKHDKNELIAIGDELFRRQGFHNTGTEEILEKADYPRSSFYYHFKDKEGFGVETLKAYGNNILGLIEQNLKDEKVSSPLQRIKNYFTKIAKYNEIDENRSCCLVQRFSIEEGGTGGTLEQEANIQFRRWVDLMANCIKLGQDQNEIRSDMTSEELAEFLFTNIYGSATIAKLSGDFTEMQKKMNLAFKLIEK